MHTKKFLFNLSTKVLSVVVALVFVPTAFTQEETQKAEVNLKQSQGKKIKSLGSKRKRRKRRRKISRKKLEAYIQRGLQDGTLSLDRLNELETKYFSKDMRYVPYVNQHPFMPHKWDYGVELGTMEIEQPLYWVGGNLGYNIGTCVLTDSPSCQQYMDVLLGSSGRDAETNWYGVVSMRWQFVNFPNTYSPIARVFAGVMNRIANDDTKQFFVYGVGYGITTYLYPRADLRMELRHGWGKEIGSFSQAFVSVELKVSRWLDFFAGKLEKVGIGTGKVLQKGVGGAGSVIKGTGEVIQKGVKGTGTVIKDSVQGTGNLIKKGVNKVSGSAEDETDRSSVKSKEVKNLNEDEATKNEE